MNTSKNTPKTTLQNNKNKDKRSLAKLLEVINRLSFDSLSFGDGYLKIRLSSGLAKEVAKKIEESYGSILFDGSVVVLEESQNPLLFQGLIKNILANIKQKDMARYKFDMSAIVVDAGNIIANLEDKSTITLEFKEDLHDFLEQNRRCPAYLNLLVGLENIAYKYGYNALSLTIDVFKNVAYKKANIIFSLGNVDASPFVFIDLLYLFSIASKEQATEIYKYIVDKNIEGARFNEEDIRYLSKLLNAQ